MPPPTRSGGGGGAPYYFYPPWRLDDADEKRKRKREAEKASSDTAGLKLPQWLRASHPPVLIEAPFGWTVRITTDREWALFEAPKRDAVLGFTTFRDPGQATTRLAKAVEVFGVSDPLWDIRRASLKVGRGKTYHATLGLGTATFFGPNAYVWYATIAPRELGEAHMLIVFAVAGSSPQALREQAQAVLDSIHAPAEDQGKQGKQ